MSDLVIVESPAKAKTIKKYLGSNYEVVASMGHVRDLPKARLSVDIKNDFSPKRAIKVRISLRRISIMSPLSRSSTEFPSMDKYALRVWSFSVVTEICFCAPITNGFAPIECAQIGVRIKASASGSTIGPPADMEYPVEPVAVETITPSPE